MKAEGLLAEAFVYLAAAVLAVPLAKRLGLGSVLGYLLAGVAIGPAGLHLLSTGGEDVMHVAEFGVVMMLFVIGLELEPQRLWRLRGPIFGLGGLQVTITALALGGLALGLGLPWQAALAVGLTLSLSSTAIVLQTLAEKGLLKSAGGQSTFAVLLFQDIAVIPMLALLPLLATGDATGGSAGAHGAAAGAGATGWAQAGIVVAAVAFVVLSGRYLVRPLFRVLARTQLREILTAATLLLVVGTALLMTTVGLSPALGTFLAGVVLANSEYRHELESDIEPFRGLLLGLFFIAVGSSIDFALIAAQPLLIAGLVLGVVATKLAVLLALTRLFGLDRGAGLLVAFALPQVGEFAFVLLAFAGQSGVLGATVTDPLVAVVALSMAITPLLLVVHERVVQPRFAARAASAAREPDAVEERGTVLVAGFGEFGATVVRLLRASGVRPTVLDVDADRVELLRRLGLTVHYGDALRLDLLRTAGAGEARLLVVALDSPERTLALVRAARHAFPRLTILARAFGWDDAYELLDAGVAHVYRQSADTAARAGVDALRLLGARAHQAHRAAQRLLRRDEQAMRDLAAERGDATGYVRATRSRIQETERLLLEEMARVDGERDGAWDPETLREEARRPGPPDAAEAAAPSEHRLPIAPPPGVPHVAARGPSPRPAPPAPHEEAT